jgi:hypothetical protein
MAFYSALTHSPHHSADRADAAQLLHTRLVDRVIEAVPAGGDQGLVRAALNDGAHVYLTRDKGVVRASDQLRAVGLSVMTPGDLLEALSLYGALNFLWNPTRLYWSLPDQEKVAHRSPFEHLDVVGLLTGSAAINARESSSRHTTRVRGTRNPPQDGAALSSRSPSHSSSTGARGHRVSSSTSRRVH